MNTPIAPPQVYEVRATFPEKLDILFQPSRYKVAHGGRGGAKSWSFARALLILGCKRKLRVLCCREIQKSIEDSVHQILADQIDTLGLGGMLDEKTQKVSQPFYRVGKTKIWSPVNGTTFSFAGLWMNVDSIKSKEAIDVVWVEEAHKVSKLSWQKLIPTIRKDAPGGPLGTGSEIWVSFNPELEEDDTYQRFIVHKPESAQVIEINWRDNPWFPQVLMEDMQADREKNYDDYLHIWEGKPKQFLEGAIYANELRRCREEGRITAVNYSAVAPVHTFWDLGWSDLISIWFVQKIGTKYNLIDYWQDRKRTVEYIFANVFADPQRRYNYGRFILPHDAAHGYLASGGLSVEDLVKAQVGDPARVEVLPNVDVAQGINAARTVFGQCYFDEGRCADGLNALRHYRYDVDEETKLFSKIPLHDHHSHGADAFRYFAFSVNSLETTGIPAPKLRPPPPPRTGPLAWMGR